MAEGLVGRKEEVEAMAASVAEGEAGHQVRFRSSPEARPHRGPQPFQGGDLRRSHYHFRKCCAFIPLQQICLLFRSLLKRSWRSSQPQWLPATAFDLCVSRSSLSTTPYLSAPSDLSLKKQPLRNASGHSFAHSSFADNRVY